MKRLLAGPGAAAAAAAAAAFLAYLPGLRNGFAWDDAVYVVSNPFLADPLNLLALLKPATYLSGMQLSGAARPLFLASLIVDHALWGLRAGGYHLTNILLHAGVSALVAAAAARLTGSSRAALLAGLLFAVHPAHGEAVHLISFRADILAAGFCLLGLQAFLGGRGLVLAACFAAAMLSKQSAAPLPLLLAAVALFFPELRPRPKRWLAAAAASALFLIGYAALQRRTFDYDTDAPTEFHPAPALPAPAAAPAPEPRPPVRPPDPAAPAPAPEPVPEPAPAPATGADDTENPYAADFETLRTDPTKLQAHSQTSVPLPIQATPRERLDVSAPRDILPLEQRLPPEPPLGETPSLIPGETRGGGGARNVAPPPPMWEEVFHSPVKRLPLHAGAFATYCRLYLWPHPLVADRAPYPVESPLAPRALLGFALFAGLFGAAWALRARVPLAALGAAWFPLALLPVLGLIPIYNPIAERYLYLAGIGPAFLFAGFLGRARGRAAWSAVPVLAALAAAAFLRAPAFHDDGALFQDAGERAVQNDRPHYNLGHLAQKAARFEEAEAHYRRALALNPRSFAARNNLAGLLMQRGATEEALALLRAGLDAAPDSAPLLASLGGILASLDKPHEAAVYLRRAIDAEPDLVEVRITAGDVFASLMHFNEAQKHYAHALRLAPERQEVREHLAEFYRALRWPRHEVRELRTLSAALPERRDLRFSLAKALARAKDWSGAIEVLRGLMARAPRAEVAYALREAYRGAEDAAAERGWIDEVAPALLAEPRQFALLGSLLARRGQEKTAETVLLRAAKELKEPDLRAAARWELGLLYQRAGGVAAAKKAYRAAFELDPRGQTAAASNLAMLLSDVDADHPAAIALLRAALEHRPREFPLRINLGEVLLRAGRTEEGEKVLRDVLADNVDQRRPYLLLGDVERGRGKLQKAAELWWKARLLDPRDPRVYDALERVLGELGDAPGLDRLRRLAQEAGLGRKSGP